MRQAPARTPAPGRPRVEGDREQQVLDAALDILGEVGYDKLTLDKVAARARAGKATLYRRWPSKAELVADAMASLDGGDPVAPDTGSLRGDLLAMSAERDGGLLDPARMPLLIGLMTAMYRDPALSAALRGRVVDPRRSCLVTVIGRAKARGEVAAEVDADLVAGIVPAMIVFWLTVEGRTDVAALVPRVVDEIVLPAVLRRSG
jgi:AcrR family transcriptional regulator